jgi:hypothetical protein
LNFTTDFAVQRGIEIEGENARVTIMHVVGIKNKYIEKIENAI